MFINFLILTLLSLKYLNIKYYFFILIILPYLGYSFQLILILCVLISNISYRKTHLLSLVLLLILLTYSSYTITIFSSSNLIYSNNIIVNLPLVHTSIEDFSRNIQNSYHSSLTSNLSDTKSFFLSLNNYYSTQKYEISNLDTTIYSSVIDFFNILIILVTLIPYLLIKKSLYNIMIIRI